MKKNVLLTSVISLMIIALLLTSCSAPKQPAEVVAPMPTAAPAQPTAEVVPPTATAIPPTQAPTVAPTNTPVPVLAELTLTGRQGFVIEDTSGVFLFEVENTNPKHAIEDSQFQIAIYDAANTVLDTNDNYIPVILPGEKQFIAYYFYLEDNQVADHIEVQLRSGKAEEFDLANPVFSIDQVQFLPDEYSPQVSGIINNNISNKISDLKVTAVAFDAQGQVVGGGYTYLNFLGPNSKSAIGVNVKVNQEPARVELYTAVSSFSAFTEEDSTEAVLMLLDQGFIQGEYSAGAIFLVQNTSTDSVIEDSEYRAEAYDEAGTVLATDEGYIEAVFPGETLAIYTDLYLPDGATLANVVIQLNQGEVGSLPYQANPFSSTMVKYNDGEYSDSVTAIIANSDANLIEGPKVVAIGYDADGKINGGGYAYLDFVPGQGQTGVSISYDGKEPPTTVSVFAALSGLSSLSSSEKEMAIELLDFGFGVDFNYAGVGFLMRNTSTSDAIDSARYQITGYDPEGYVINTDSGSAGLFYPGQTLAGYGEFAVPEGVTLERVEVQLLQGETATPLTPEYPFTTENVTFIPGSYSQKVTGIVKNAFEKDINDIRVLAIAYDAAGKIIGGGYTYVDFVPANGQSAVEVNVTIGGEPAKVELYPLFSSLTEIAE